VLLARPNEQPIEGESEWLGLHPRRSGHFGLLLAITPLAD